MKMRARRIVHSALAAMLLAGGAACHAPRPDGTPLGAVTHVDLDRYTGRWYEIAKIPNRFQRQCASDTTATYARNADGTVTVVNRCRESDGRLVDARGVARVVDPGSNAKLEVSFFSLLGWRPVWGDYWVLALGPDYGYAVVGEPSRRYGWVLSRTPTLPAATRATINAQLRKLGYAPGQFADSPHTGRSTPDVAP